MFTVSLVTADKLWKQPKCPLTGAWTNTCSSHVHALGCCSATERSRTHRDEPRGIELSEKSIYRTARVVWPSETLQKAKPMCGCLGLVAWQRWTASGPLGIDGRKYSRTVLAMALYIYQNNWIVCLEWMSFMVRKSHLSKAVPTEGTENEFCQLNAYEKHCLST